MQLKIILICIIIQEMVIPKRLISTFFALVIVFALGIIGYILIEGWTFLEACFMTVITLATVGYGETRPLTQAGRIFTIFFIIGGYGVVLYGISSLTAFLVEGELKDILRRRKMEKNISKLTDHYIICGADTTGEFIIEEMQKTNKQFVVIEKDKNIVNNLLEKNILIIEGDATHDEVLIEAGIKNAKGLISVLPNDKDNLFVVLTAKGLNPNLRIVAKAVEEESQNKLRRAGADAIVSPNYIGGLRMVSEMIRPTVVSFLDTMMREKGSTLRVEDVEITPLSNFIGKTLDELKIPQKVNLSVVAIKHPSTDTYEFNPKASSKLGEGDFLIVMGEIVQVEKLREFVKES